MRMKKENKNEGGQKQEGEKQTHNERKGYLGREEKGEKEEKIFGCLMKVDRSGLSPVTVISVFFFFIEMRKTERQKRGMNEGEAQTYVSGNHIFVFF